VSSLTNEQLTIDFSFILVIFLLFEVENNINFENCFHWNVIRSC